MKTTPSEKNPKPCEIAVIGIGCNYPGAKSPKQFWENILARKQQFREMPDIRLPLTEYYDPDPTVADKTYQKKAAVLDGYKFNWLDRKIPKSTFESTDIVHWLALDTALQALADTRIPLTDIPHETTGVILGNTLTGEFTRSNHMLLRWPYVKKALRSSLKKKGLLHIQDSLEATMEKYYKSVFAPVTEDTLAGGLANTIAGRVCNFLDINGGGYIVDGACSSSLLAICTAANYLEMGQMDMVIAGGVDISLDTFELIGFAKTGALTRDEMRVYDKQGKGFIPGEGCGIVILKRLEDAVRDKDQVYAILQGWGISSDGKGGITAPSAIGQSRALTRAYKKARFNPENLNFIEGHGTGTTVGDKVELEGISIALNNDKKTTLRNCGVTSLKSIIGHTKAAAGVGAFIKTTLALNRRVIPPTAGLRELNPIFDDKAKKIYPVLYGQVNDPASIMYAGVSAMGFGGINSHVILKSGDLPFEKIQPIVKESKLLVSNQSHELFLFAATDKEGLMAEVNQAIERSKGISCGELADFASQWNLKLNFKGSYRAAVVIAEPFELERKLKELIKILTASREENYVAMEGNSIVFGKKKENLRIGALYPGQGSQRLNMAYKLVERYDWAKEMVGHAEKIFKQAGNQDISSSIFRPLDRVLDNHQEKEWKDILRQTNIAQPAITLVSLLWHTYIKKLGIKISATTGHSLGELMAFHAAGFIDEDTLLQFAAYRGKIMAGCGRGTMASLVCPKEQAGKYIKLAPGYVDIANINTNDQTVISGEEESIEFIIKKAEEDHIGAVRLPVSAAFHSNLIGDAAVAIKKYELLNIKSESSDQINLISSVTGQNVSKNTDLNEYFSEQCIKRVNFIDTIQTLKNECDVLIEIGSGKILSGLSESIQQEIKAFPVESKPTEDQSLNLMLANIFTMGADIEINELYKDRLIRDFVPAAQKEFIVNPCERPFPEIEDDNIMPDSSNNTGLLMQNLNFSGDVFNEYMKVRGGFVNEMIQTDMRYFQIPGNITPVGSFAKLANQTFPVVKTSADTLNANTDVRNLLFKKIESVTGFPAENFKENMKLLDDFNLDSIKAGSLLNDIFKSLHIVGKINPSNFLNASLENIKIEIEKITGNTTQTNNTLGTPKENIENAVFELIAEKTGFPRDGLQPSFRLLNDLNLDSIKAGSLLAQLVKKYDLQGKMEVAAHANASIAEIINKISEFMPADQTSQSLKINQEDIQKFVFSQIVEKTGFPQDAIKPEFKLLDDLNLDSIKANAVIAGLLKFYGLQGKLEPVKFSNASLTAIIHEIFSLVSSNDKLQQVQPKESNSISNQVHSYSVSLVTDNLVQDKNQEKQFWEHKKVVLVCTQSNRKFAGLLQKTLPKFIECEVENSSDFLKSSRKYHAVIAILPESKTTEVYHETVELLSIISQYKSDQVTDIGFIQFGDGSFSRGKINEKNPMPSYSAIGFAASLHLERPGIKLRSSEFDRDLSPEFIGSSILQDFSLEPFFLATCYNKDKQRQKMEYDQTENTVIKPRGISLTENDVVIVTGGAKGITSECALTLARKYHCKMALVGTSAYHGEAGEIKTILEKYASENLIAKYYTCNITDAGLTISLAKDVSAELGKITAIVHGAGKNVPRRSENVTTEQVLDEISPKINGAINLLNAVNPKDLKLFVAFTSIIGVTGMAGNSWYAFSNETLDLFLRNLKNTYQIETIALAYSIWSEVGMGERMGSTVALAKMGIGSINPADGMNEFMKWIEQKTDDQQIVIASTLGGLDTWVRKSFPKPDASRYLDKIQYFEPGIELKVRSTISQKTDVYIDDHNYKGSLLFPTVFGLEAMAQAASMVTNITKFASVKLDDIMLTRPIVVPQQGETEIEIHAVVIDSDQDHSALKMVKVGISTEHSGFTDSHFSATFTFGGKAEKQIIAIDVDKNNPLPINPKLDLYGSLLFQGPRFQQIEKVYGVSSASAIFGTKKLPGDTSELCFSSANQKPLLLGSPLLRDTLLQSVQLMLTNKLVLPIGIDSWEINYPDNQPKGGIVKCSLTSWDENTGLCDVVYVNDKMEVMEKIHGYKVKSMEPIENYPSPAELSEIENYVNKKISEALSSIENLSGEKINVATYKHTEDFKNVNQPERRKIAQQVFDQFIKENNVSRPLTSNKIIWTDNGKPGFDKQDLQISISHSSSILMMTLGQSTQGCDIELVEPRPKDEWEGILNQKFTTLIDQLTALKIDLNRAYTMLWGVQETCIKAYGILPDSISIAKPESSGVIFNISKGDEISQVYACPVTIYTGKVFIVTVLFKEKVAPIQNLPVIENIIAGLQPIDDIFDPKSGKFITQFFTAFKDCRGFFAKTYFINFPFWMGNLREYILTPVKKKLLKDLGSGEFGMVTNNSKVHIYDEAETLDKITGRLWITEKSDLKNSLIDLGYEWLKHTEDGKIVKIAECELSTTWVKIEERGIVKLSPIPGYFYKFLDDHIRNGISNDILLTTTNYPTQKDLGKLLYKSSTIPRPAIVLNKKVYHTGIYNANTVGNLYYSNYYDWQAKNIESYLFKLMPEIYTQNGRIGEYICLETNVNHLQEAMPFEEIEVVMFLEQLYDNGFKLYFEFYSVGANHKRKLAYGSNLLLWAKRKNEEFLPVATTLPEQLMQLLNQHVVSGKEILM